MSANPQPLTAGGLNASQPGSKSAQQIQVSSNTVDKKSSGTGSAPASSQTATIVGSHYKIGKKIGEGSFGIIYEGEKCVGACSMVSSHRPVVCVCVFSPLL